MATRGKGSHKRLNLYEKAKAHNKRYVLSFSTSYGMKYRYKNSYEEILKSIEKAKNDFGLIQRIRVTDTYTRKQIGEKTFMLEVGL